MSGNFEGQAEAPQARESRHRELRDLLVSAADAARKTRQNALNATLGSATSQAVRKRVADFFAAAP